MEAFAQGAPQEDDITIVLVKREAGSVTADRSFRRSFDSLEEIFAFTSDFFAAHGIDRGLLPTVDLALEELFTNMVKYSPGGRGPHPHRDGHDAGRRRSDADRL